MEKGKDIFEIEMFGEKHEIKIEYGSYNCNGTLALQMFCKLDPEEMALYGNAKNIDPYQSPYGIATVNLPESEALPVNVQFVDENNLPGIGKWLQDNGIAEPAGFSAHSGYCTYQAFTFNAPEKELEKIQHIREDIIATRIISSIESSGMKPTESTSRGDRYHIAAGTDIVLYKGGTDKNLGSKPDVFLLASSSKHKDRDMWRLRNLPSDVRQSLSNDINKALTETRSTKNRIR